MNSYIRDARNFNISSTTYYNQSSFSNSIYSSTPKILKVNNKQFEILFPFIDIFDQKISAFMSFEKRYVVVEFSTFVKFIVNNVREDYEYSKSKTSEKFVFTHDMKIETKKENEKSNDKQLYGGIIFGYENMYQHASSVENFLKDVKREIQIVSDELNKVPTILEVSSNLSTDIKRELITLTGRKPNPLTELWQAFLVNIAILNVKSMILCGEYNKNNLSKSNKPVIPLRFIPKLGSELSVFSKGETTTLTEVQNRLISTDTRNEFVGKVIISTLKKSEEENFLDYGLDGEPIDIFKIAEGYGYSYDRYFEASQVITDSASSSVTALEECEKYLDSFSDYIEILGDLYSNLKYYNKHDKIIILDFEIV